jgi:putative membrane protein
MAPNSPTTSHTEPQRFSSDELALDRTRLAHERTMMAWIRTSASMISFGFGIYKFFDYFKGDRPVTQGIVTPRRFAIFLIATGLIVRARVPRSLAGGIAILMSIIGALALITTILRQ